MTTLIDENEIIFDQEAHSYHLKGIRYKSVSQIIRENGLGQNFDMCHPAVLESAQRRGRMVHLACQYFDEGILDISSVDDSIKGYVYSYIRFREECKITPIDIEKPMVCPYECRLCRHDSRVHTVGGCCDFPGCNCFMLIGGHGFAGTPDLVCWIGGRRAIIDRKTAQTMAPSMGIQTAGYQILREAVVPREKIHERYGLRLQKNEKYKLFPHERLEDILAFRDCLSGNADRLKSWQTFYGVAA